MYHGKDFFHASATDLCSVRVLGGVLYVPLLIPAILPHICPLMFPHISSIYIRSARTTATSAEKAGNAAVAAALMMGSVDQVLRGHPLGAAQTASAVGWQSVVARMGLLHSVQSTHTLSVLSVPAVLSH